LNLDNVIKIQLSTLYEFITKHFKSDMHGYSDQEYNILVYNTIRNCWQNNKIKPG